jgi:hypothetical protein
MEVAVQMGRRDEAERSFKSWQATSRDDGSDCPACEQDRLVEYLRFRGEYAQAIKKASRILNGTLACAEIPQLTLATLLVPMLECNHVELAETTAKKGYRMVRSGGDFLDAIGKHLEYAVLVGNLRLAVNMLERHLGPALAAYAEADRLSFLRPSVLLFMTLARKSRRKRKLRLPPESPLRNSSGDYDSEEILAWLSPEVHRLTEALDRRNGNEHHAQTFRAAVGRLERLDGACRA